MIYYGKLPVMNWTKSSNQSLLDALLALESRAEAQRFLRDLLTEFEIAEFANRWQAAQLLDRGTSYVQIRRQTGLSSRTIARIQKWLTQGTGGYRLMIDRLAASTNTSHHPPRPLAVRGSFVS